MLKVKKLLMALFAMMSVTFGAMASDSYSRDASVLPIAAKTTIERNFKSKVSLVKIDKDLGRISEYEVILSDGSEISFDRDGNWKDVEVNNSKSVPSGFIPAGVTQYIKVHQKGKKVVGIEKKRDGFEVELNNGVEMRFDKQGNFLRYEK